MFDKIEEQLKAILKTEFKHNPEIESALSDVLESINSLKGAILVEKDETLQRIEARDILRENIDRTPFFARFSNVEKDMVANLALKYNKDIPSDNAIREYIYRRLVDIDDASVLLLAYGRSTIEKLGRNLGASEDDAYNRGIKALHKDAFMPNSIEPTYGMAIKTIYNRKPLLLGFLIDYFRRSHGK